MRFGIWVSLAAVWAGLTVGARSARATLLIPGQNPAPNASATNPLTAAGNAIAAHIGADVSQTSHGAFLDVTYDAWVVRIGSSDLASNQVAGDLDFVYQFHVNADSTTLVENTWHFNYTGFSTDVSYFSTATGQLAPNVATSDGTIVKFTYLGDGDVQPGMTSALEIIATNATEFSDGKYAFQDGLTLIADAFEPGGPTPEPGALTLAVTAVLAGLGAAAARWRRSKSAAH